MPVFDGMEFGITGRGKDVTATRTLIEANGGSVRSNETASLRGIVVGSSAPSALKVAKAVALGVPPITVEWIDQCVSAGKVLPLPKVPMVVEELLAKAKEGGTASNANAPSPVDEGMASMTLGAAKKSTQSAQVTKKAPQRSNIVFDEESDGDEWSRPRHSVTPEVKKTAPGPGIPRSSSPGPTVGLMARTLFGGLPTRGNKGTAPTQPPRPVLTPRESNIASTSRQAHHDSVPLVDDSCVQSRKVPQEPSKDVPPLTAYFPSKITPYVPPPNARRELLSTHTSSTSTNNGVAVARITRPPASPSSTTTISNNNNININNSIGAPRNTVASTPPTSPAPTPSCRPTAGVSSMVPKPHPDTAGRKPPVPRLAASSKAKDACDAKSREAENILQRVLQHPAGKTVDVEAAKQIILQIVDTASAVLFSDIAGLEFCKQILHEVVILPAKRPELFTGLRKPCTALLLFGPPGNGKTMLAKAVACECNTTFFNISASAITSKWVGDSEKLVRALFGVARALSPSTIFIDEIDSMLQSRGSSTEMEGSRRLKTEFLVQMDGAGNDYSECRVLVMGATNRPFDLDDAVLRRFPKRVLVPLPDATTRRVLVENLLKETRTDLTPSEWKKFAEATEDYSASDLSQLCKEMAMAPIRDLGVRVLEASLDDLRPLTYADVKGCMKTIRPSASKEVLQKLSQWNDDYGSVK